MPLGVLGTTDTPVMAYHTVVTTYAQTAELAGEHRAWWMLEKGDQLAWATLVDQLHEVHVCMSSLTAVERALVWARVKAAHGELDPVIIINAIEAVIEARAQFVPRPLYRGGAWTGR